MHSRPPHCPLPTPAAAAEAGHVCLQRMKGDTFAGVDPLFGASVEGLAATPGLATRKGTSLCVLSPVLKRYTIFPSSIHTTNFKSCMFKIGAVYFYSKYAPPSRGWPLHRGWPNAFVRVFLYWRGAYHPVSLRTSKLNVSEYGASEYSLVPYIAHGRLNGSVITGRPKRWYPPVICTAQLHSSAVSGLPTSMMVPFSIYSDPL
jgi:hypothetical protein